MYTAKRTGGSRHLCLTPRFPGTGYPGNAARINRQPMPNACNATSLAYSLLHSLPETIHGQQ